MHQITAILLAGFAATLLLLLNNLELTELLIIV